MITSEFKCFCRMCHHEFVAVTDISTTKIGCPKCKHSHDFGHLSRHWIEIGKNIKKLKKDLANLYFYTRVEFEHDFKQYNDIDSHFRDYCELSREEEVSFPFRSDVVAFKFKFQDNSTFTFHDEGIMLSCYDAPLHLQESSSFQEAIKYPHRYVYEEESQYNYITLHDFALVAFYAKQYQAYHLHTSQTLAFFPMFVFR